MSDTCTFKYILVYLHIVNLKVDIMDSKEMPKYKCKKVVHALKIKEISPLNFDKAIYDSGAIIYPKEKGYEPFRVSGVYVFKHKPQAGGYYVLYEDGYESYSPAKAFENGYELIK